VKFTCDRCGKKYATAEDPAPGRVYKLKCKACGQVIVVRAAAGGPGAPAPTVAKDAPASTSIGEPACPPATVVASAPAPARTSVHAQANGASAGAPELPAPTPLPAAAERRADVAGMSPPADGAGAPQVDGAGAPQASGDDPGYVDLFADGVTGEHPLPGPSDDPFAAAARSSLPDASGETAMGPPSDPFAPLGDGGAEARPLAPEQARTPVPRCRHGRRCKTSSSSHPLRSGAAHRWF
jgi:hypothetical protein